MPTQLQIARSGQITDTVKCVAQRENIPAKVINDELAAGRLVILANKIHLADNLVPAAVGRKVSVKINANIGVSALSSSLDEELMKMKIGQLDIHSYQEVTMNIESILFEDENQFESKSVSVSLSELAIRSK